MFGCSFKYEGLTIVKELNRYQDARKYLDSLVIQHGEVETDLFELDLVTVAIDVDLNTEPQQCITDFIRDEWDDMDEDQIRSAIFAAWQYQYNVSINYTVL